MNSNEKLHLLIDAIEKETGQRIHPSSGQRWRLRGIAGEKLTTVRMGGKRMCTQSHVRGFLERVTAATVGNAATSEPRTPKQRERDIQQAERELDRAGI